MCTPDDLFTIGKREAIVNRYLTSFRRGEVDYETMLNELCKSLETIIKDLGLIAGIKDDLISANETRANGENIPFPVLEYSIIPKLTPELTPLERQTKLILTVIELLVIKNHVTKYMIDKQSMSKSPAPIVIVSPEKDDA